MSARDLYVHTARTYWRRAGYLMLLGIAVFVPLGLLDALADRAREIRASDLGALSDLGTAALVAGFLVQTVTALLGEVFYSGAVALALAGGEAAEPPSLRSVASRLKYGRLIAVDIIFGVLTAIGLVALVVPGLIFFTWFSLAGPVVELEGTGVRAAFARSRRLVRGRFWTVLLVLLPITLSSEALTAASLQGLHELIHSPLLSDWTGEAVTSILLTPFYAVAAVLITLEASRGGP